MRGSHVLQVPRGRFSFDEPWAAPRNATPVRFTRSTDGSTSRLSTDLTVYHDTATLFLLFSGQDDGVVATMRDHDAPLWREDVMEAFLSPADLREYFEIEVNPLGAMFDARIVSPDGNRSTMKADTSWDCTGAWSALRRDYAGDGSFRFQTLLSIPFEALSRGTPDDGEEWKANFYRIDRSDRGDEYTAWRPTLRNPPDFHVPAAFGTLRFRS